MSKEEGHLRKFPSNFICRAEIGELSQALSLWVRRMVGAWTARWATEKDAATWKNRFFIYLKFEFILTLYGPGAHLYDIEPIIYTVGDWLRHLRGRARRKRRF